MIDSQEISLMRELVDVQAARASNWPTPCGPTDKELEAVHRAKISSIRKQLSARRVSGPENLPAVATGSFTEPEGLWKPRRATFLSRVMRRVFRSQATTDTKRSDLSNAGEHPVARHSGNDATPII